MNRCRKCLKPNRRNFELYQYNLSDIPGVRLRSYDSANSNFHYVVLEVDEGNAGVSLDELLEILHAEGVLARRYFYPGCHRSEPYRTLFPEAGLFLPVTERMNQQLMQLPTGSSIGQPQIETICAIIRFSVTNSDYIRAGMKTRAAGAVPQRGFLAV